MEKSQVEQILVEEVAVILAVDKTAINVDRALHTLGIDSLSFVEILVFIEKKFDLKLMETDLTRQDFRTISSLASYISKRG